MARIFCTLVLSILSLSVNAKTIVVLGDSISAAYGIEVDKGWVQLLQKKLDHEKFSYKIHNESISGDTTAGGLARIDKALLQYQPTLVMIELGANDGLRGLSPVAMKANLAEIIRRAQSAEANVLLLGMRIPPNYGKRYIEMFYNVYPQLAQEMNIPYVPFLLEDVALQKKYMQNDGLHPNAQAQPLIADKVWQYLAAML